MTAQGPGESSRLATLRDYGVLDTEAEQDFDDLTRLAAFVCGTPISLVSLVDAERLWFKSRFGVEAVEAPRQHAFCDHAIREPERMLVVEDAQRDHRFRDNPMVAADPHVRFYAGVPLVAPSGAGLGTLCVIDHRPRALDEEQREMLRALARQVMSQLELRRSLALIQSMAEDEGRRVELMERYLQSMEVENASLQQHSLTDALTGIANRRWFDERFVQELSRADRTGTAVAVALLDVDHFKAYNDEHGHLAGDEALARLAHVMQQASRSYDFVARYGGEEFAVIVPDTSLELAAGIVDRIRLSIERLEWPLRPVTISAGVALGAKGEPASSMLARADRALYEAKRQGRNRVVRAGDAPPPRERGTAT